MGVYSSTTNHRSAIFDFIPSYAHDRYKVRKDLILKFINNPENKPILDNIRDLRSLIVRDKELCATGYRENLHRFDVSPTCMEGAEYELMRLYKIFEKSRHLKSAKGRMGAYVACPYGHAAKKFDDVSGTVYPSGTDIICKICDKPCLNGGYQCGFCEYDLCDVCCVIYCAEGHEMKLWTMVEGDFMCSVCKQDPITAGYHCDICVIDICDICTYKPGRKAVQSFQITEMNELISFMSDFREESWTAKRLTDRHWEPTTSEDYMRSTRTLHQYVAGLRRGKDDTQEEVKQHRIWKEVIRLRGVIAQERNATANRELKNVGNFTEFEISRLNRVIQVSQRASSVLGRRNYYMGCPLGHYAAPFKGIPPAWYKLDRAPLCSICERIADEGCYCPICEYPLCTVCSVVYCYEGHEMTMWTEPEVAMNVLCLLCHTEYLKSGYHCSECNVDLCDACTSQSGRNQLKFEKIKELHKLSTLIDKYKDKSDMAYSYKDKHIPYITSMRKVCDYIAQLRRDMDIARRQHMQYEYICKMKSLRRRIIKYAGLCASATKELNYQCPYDFQNKREVKAELDRLKNIIDTQRYYCSLEAREPCITACPLGHTMNFSIYANGTIHDNQPELILEMKHRHDVLNGNIQRRARRRSSASTTMTAIAHMTVTADNNVDKGEITTGEGGDDNASVQAEGVEGQLVKTSQNNDVKVGMDDNASFGEDELGYHKDDFPFVDVTKALSQKELDNKIFQCAVCCKDINKQTAEDTYRESIMMTDGGASSYGGTWSSLSPFPSTVLDGGTGASGDSAIDQVLRCGPLGGLMMGSTTDTCSAGSGGSDRAGDEVCSMNGTGSEHKSTSQASKTEDTSIKSVDNSSGCYCAYCDYALCKTCRVIYCRKGHICSIWTNPEAIGHSCDICYKNELTAGYQCTTCNIDICDLCTTRETRNALLMLPKRDFRTIYSILESNQLISPTSRKYCKEYPPERIQACLSSMSVLCRELERIRLVQTIVEKEVVHFERLLHEKKFAIKSNDL